MPTLSRRYLIVSWLELTVFACGCVWQEDLYQGTWYELAYHDVTQVFPFMSRKRGRTSSCLRPSAHGGIS